MATYGSYNQEFNDYWKHLAQADTMKEQLRFNEKYGEELKDWEKYQDHLRRKGEAKQKAQLAVDVAAAVATGGQSLAMKGIGEAMGTGSPLGPIIDFGIDSALDGLFKTKQMVQNAEFMNMHPSDFARLRRKAFATQKEFDAIKKGELVTGGAKGASLIDYIAPMDAQGNVTTIVDNLVQGPEGGWKGGRPTYFEDKS